MRVLILTCNTGEGHNSCAKAIKIKISEIFSCYGVASFLTVNVGTIKIRINNVIGVSNTKKDN